MTMTTTPTTGQHVKVLVGLYKGCTARVISIERIAPDRHSVLIEYLSGYRVRYLDTEVAIIRDI
jgi:hypothetical protein